MTRHFVSCTEARKKRDCQENRGSNRNMYLERIYNTLGRLDEERFSKRTLMGGDYEEMENTCFI